MRLYIVRHGEVKLNHERRLSGRIDEPLLESARELARITGKALADISFGHVFSSPLKRAKETAELILAENHTSGDRPIHIDDRLIEISFGAWDGLGCGPDNMEMPDTYRMFYTDPFTFEGGPGGESIPDVIRRTGDFYEELIHNASLQDETILIAMHGCSMRALLYHVYGTPEDFWHGHVPYNLAVNIVDVTDGKAVLTGDDLIYYDASLVNDPYTIYTED